MADINSLLAAGVKAPEFNALAPMMTLGQLRAMQTQNALNQLRLQQGQMEMNALQQYGDAIRTGDANPTRFLAPIPQLQTQALGAQKAGLELQDTQTQFRLSQISRAAQEVLSAPSDQRTSVWNAKLDELQKAGHITPAQHQQWYNNPSELVLQQAVKIALPTDAFLKRGDVEEGQRAASRFGAAITGALTPGQAPVSPAAPAGPVANVTPALTRSESGNNPATINRWGYAGLHQFGAPRLNALGVYTPGPQEDLTRWSKTSIADDPGKWSGQFNIPGFPEVKTVRDFLGNPAAQNAAYSMHTGKMAEEIKSNGLDKFIGQTVGGVPITQEGLLAMLHLGGVASTKRALQSGGQDNPADANGTTVLDYARLGARTAQTGGAATPGAIPAPIASPADAMQKITPLAFQVLAHPAIPEGTKKAAEQIIQWARENTKPTQEMQNYMAYFAQEVSGGRVPKTMEDWDINRRRAESGMEDETKKELGKGIAARLNAMAEDGDKAGDDRLLFGRLGDLLERSGTGVRQAFTEWVRGYVGPDIAKTLNPNASDAEASTALINYLMPRMRVPGTGASSDRDLAAFGKSLPSLLSTEDGRRLVIETLGGMATARQMRGDIATQVQMGEITAKEGLAQIRKLPDPFAAFKAYQKEQGGKAGVPTKDLPTFASPADMIAAARAKKLQVGDQYRTTDGRVGTVTAEDVGAQ